MNITINECYRSLELEPGATVQQIRKAYKDLVFVWHPDRIPSNNRHLQNRAQDKLKMLNAARDKILIHLEGQTHQENPSERSSDDRREPGSETNSNSKAPEFEQALRRRPGMFGEMHSEFQRVFKLHYSYSEHFDLGVPVWRPNMDIKNKFQDYGNDIVADYSTGLMWQKAGLGDPLSYNGAKGYIHSLNSSRYRGYDDWRLPTIEELMSLWSEWNEQDRYYKREFIGTCYVDPFLDPVFAEKQIVCWSADVPLPGTGYSYFADGKLERGQVKNATDAAWTINFGHLFLTGSIISAFDQRSGIWVKAVRSIG